MFRLYYCSHSRVSIRRCSGTLKCQSAPSSTIKVRSHLAADTLEMRFTLGLFTTQTNSWKKSPLAERLSNEPPVRNRIKRSARDGGNPQDTAALRLCTIRLHDG